MMMNYNFKQITTIPNSKDLIDIVLSKTQRKTPTVVHNGYAIGRIRAFYIRKVKFTQDTIHEKLSGILDGFPKLEDIHPFFADLINVLYDRDHYKLALGHVNSCRNLIDNLAKDYVRLLKYADSLYRSKQLKKAALGRMCTIIKKLTSSLNYLEEVRKHLARLPTINPFERTLLITGYPNVGKSSFTNNVTNANVDVQPYPFTTQSLYVGHTDYDYARWQVIDSPGILDHSLEERNTIEMQSITALAHLKACVLYFIDISEMCGYTISQQIQLFNNIKPLFKNKPHLLVLTKTDLKPVEQVDPEDMASLQALAKEEGVELVSMSNKDGTGITEVKNSACKLLNAYRDTQTVDQVTGGQDIMKNTENVLRGVYIAQPKKRDNRERTTYIPEKIKQQGRQKIDRPTLRQIQDQFGGAGVFDFPLQEHFDLENNDWKYDVVPEIMDGKNIADFVDKDILEKLNALEKEEEMLEKARENEIDEDEGEGLDEETEAAFQEVVSKRALKKLEHKLKQNSRSKNIHRPTMEEFEKVLPEDANKESIRQRTLKNRRKLRGLDSDFSEESGVEDDNDIVDEQEEEKRANKGMLKRHRDLKRTLSRSRTRGYKEEKTPDQKAMDRVKFKIDKIWQGRAGEADRAIGTKMPKHQFSGKRSFKSDRR
ncbi:P-loop containing nucleoside triphosphate hydrolase [Pseudocohnilembus persalinus]|uniref:Nucleolar GTP-binding protein 1 n=1 Tax=Pseudocohnilembus persalinus TaxID=266149 RepID=A0A0V0R2F1_PSEPJ|nr:P-loop containing nucleoside triphosphate hydrolase [Pseudocohnilembus persalinus]|eukprot:KRX08573.1 P-loop containing nucleoside triphosphate hydrolase [Pseudocohnilembus persalinus]